MITIRGSLIQGVAPTPSFRTAWIQAQALFGKGVLWVEAASLPYLDRLVTLIKRVLIPPASSQVYWHVLFGEEDVLPYRSENAALQWLLLHMRKGESASRARKSRVSLNHQKPTD